MVIGEEESKLYALTLNRLPHSSLLEYGKFWLKFFGQLVATSTRLNPSAKTWLTLPLLIGH